MSDNRENHLVAASTTSATPRTHSPKIIDVYLTDPPRQPLHRHDQAKKWVNFWLALISDERWSVPTGYPRPLFPSAFAPPGRHSIDVLEPVPDLKLVPTTDQRCDTCLAEAREKTRLAREILISLGFVDISGVWNPRVRMQWGYPKRERLEKTMPGLVKAGILRDVDYPVHVPSAEWVEYIEWEKYGVRAPEVETKLETETVEGKRRGRSWKL